MIPQIIDITEASLQDGKTIYIYLRENGTLCTTFKFCTIDIERSNSNELEQKIETLLRSLPEDLTFKISEISNFINEDTGHHSRVNAVKECFYRKNELTIHFEYRGISFFKSLFSFCKSSLGNLITKKDIHPYNSEIEKYLKLIPLQEFESAGIKLLPLNFEEIQGIIEKNSWPICLNKDFIKINGLNIGVVKLKKLGTSAISYETLSLVKENLPVPYEIVTTFRKIPQFKLKMILEKNRKQESGFESRSSNEKYSANDEAIVGSEMRGESYFNFEFHIILKNIDSIALTREIIETIHCLSSLGDMTVESQIGVFPSYISTLPGGGFHLKTANIERDIILPCYLPIFSRGSETNNTLSRTALAYHRLNYSIGYFDPFDHNKNNSMFTIIGQPGRGKSVFQNLLIKSIANDENSKILIVDVRGSHINTVSDLGGKIHEISIEKPTNLNPFKYLREVNNEDVALNLITFVTELILEEGETKLPTKDEYYLSEAILGYCNSNPKKPSLFDFIEFMLPNVDVNKSLYPKFPRLENLLRFSKKGIHKNVFSNLDTHSNERIHYYNISNISQASNKAIAKATMASIMAEFSFQLMTKKNNEKLLFLVDEAPFFIKECFTSFSHVSKNIRKMNGSLGIAVQYSKDLEVNGDTSLISNSDSHILFSTDRNEEEFCKLFKLSVSDYHKINKLVVKKGEYSQFLISEFNMPVVAQLKLSSEEYWKTTTYPVDLAQIDKVSEVLPKLNRNKILELIIKNDLEKEVD